jgi:hypothetical protein
LAQFGQKQTRLALFSTSEWLPSSAVCKDFEKNGPHSKRLWLSELQVEMASRTTASEIRSEKNRCASGRGLARTRRANPLAPKPTKKTTRKTS